MRLEYGGATHLLGDGLIDPQIGFVLVLTFVIHLISTLAYSVRLAGTRTGRIAITMSLFNLLALVSRTANSFQAPLLAKHIEENLHLDPVTALLPDFRWLLLSASVATLVGGLLIPTFQRILSRAVNAFSVHRSLPKLLLHGFSKVGIHHLRTSVTVPTMPAVSGFKRIRQVPLRLIVANMLVESVITVGVLASLYAGCLNPELRVTSSNLSALINGSAIIIMLLFIDPYLSILTDDVLRGEASVFFFRRCVILLVMSRFAGTVVAQLWLVPAAHIIVTIAEML